MLKVIAIIYLIYLSFILNFEAESIELRRTRKKPIINPLELKCNTSYDCIDFRMICSKQSSCVCSKFHDWDPPSKRCLANVSKISNWLLATASLDLGYVSQQEDFERVEVDGSIFLHPKWAEYEAIKETGLSHITRVIWPILLGTILIFVVYGAILLEFL